MNAYEKIVKTRHERPYYKPYKALARDWETVSKQYIRDNPDKIIGCTYFRQYQDRDGNVKSVEAWIKRMHLYQFKPIGFLDPSYSGKEGNAYRFSGNSAALPAFSEEEAKLLVLAHVQTNMTESILDKPAEEYFCRFTRNIELESVSDTVKFDSFIPAYYWPKACRDRGFFYENSEMGFARFLLDFFLKYGFERGLRPVGEPPKEFWLRYGDYYSGSFPFTDIFLMEHTYFTDED